MAASHDIHNGTNVQFGELNLSITGIGVEYPPYLLDPEALDTLCKRHYPDSPAFVPLLSPFPASKTDTCQHDQNSRHKQLYRN